MIKYNICNFEIQSNTNFKFKEQSLKYYLLFGKKSHISYHDLYE